MKKLLTIILSMLTVAKVSAQNSQIFTQSARSIWSDISTAAPYFIAITAVLGLAAAFVQYFSTNGDWKKVAGFFTIVAIIVIIAGGMFTFILNMRLG